MENKQNEKKQIETKKRKLTRKKNKKTGKKRKIPETNKRKLSMKFKDIEQEIRDTGLNVRSAASVALERILFNR